MSLSFSALFALAATPPGVASPSPPVHQSSPLLYPILSIYVLVCLGLVVLILFQTTKSEGLSGSIGGRAESSIFRGKLGREEQLNKYTTYLAVAFLFFSTLIMIIGF